MPIDKWLNGALHHAAAWRALRCLWSIVERSWNREPISRGRDAAVYALRDGGSCTATGARAHRSRDAMAVRSGASSIQWLPLAE
jgi:hypothetical protein